MKPPVRLTLDKVPEFMAAMKLLRTEAVYVGVPGEKAERGGPINNAAIGYIQENGSTAANIPARPHLVPGVAAVKAQVAEELGAGAAALLNGRPDAVRTSYNRAGMIARDSVKRHITQQIGFAPLSETTLERRRTRKKAPRQGTKALIDTAQYLNSQTYVIRKK